MHLSEAIENIAADIEGEHCREDDVHKVNHLLSRRHAGVVCSHILITIVIIQALTSCLRGFVLYGLHVLCVRDMVGVHRHTVEAGMRCGRPIEIHGHGSQHFLVH